MKSAMDIRGVRDIRSIHGTGRRAIPRAQSSAHLDLYVLGKEQERLEKEASLLEKRTQTIQKRLGDIRRQADGLEKAARAEGRALSDERPEAGNGSDKRWRTFPLEY